MKTSLASFKVAREEGAKTPREEVGTRVKGREVGGGHGRHTAYSSFHIRLRTKF